MWQADRLHADYGMKILQSDVDRLAKICELSARKIKASFVCVILYTLTQEFLSNHFDALSYSRLDGTFSHGPGRMRGEFENRRKTVFKVVISICQ
jgi:hypothetical protein